MTFSNGSFLGSACVIVVDDEPANIAILRRLLARTGVEKVFCTTDPREAAKLCVDHPPDMVLLDFAMPHLDGIELLGQLKSACGADAQVPMIMLSGDMSVEIRQRALHAGAVDFLTKPFDNMEVELRIRNHLEVRSLYVNLEDLVQARTQQLEHTYQEMLVRLAQAAEFRDDETGQHTRRVGEYSARIAVELGLSANQVDLIRLAAPLHDVGKIAIPDAILLSAGRLSPEETAVMRTHTSIGARLLCDGRTELCCMAERIALTHHERWDGAGYPEGLAGEAIPIEGRIVALADFFDAVSRDRRYRPAWPMAKVMEEIAAESGKHFDPDVVGAFMRANL
ncbi:MAG TPA: HD domain-containing phosphohydrolase [Gemmatimonadaceae bacterium]|nr:HD domain-containing phosphohydrolase [Gemmatimonadaceae bacterium]